MARHEKKIVWDWQVGEVGFHSFHGRVVVCGINPDTGMLITVREYDKTEKYVPPNELTPIERWDANEELRKLAEQMEVR